MRDCVSLQERTVTFVMLNILNLSKGDPTALTPFLSEVVALLQTVGIHNAGHTSALENISTLLNNGSSHDVITSALRAVTSGTGAILKAWKLSVVGQTIMAAAGRSCATAASIGLTEELARRVEEKLELLKGTPLQANDKEWASVCELAAFLRPHPEYADLLTETDKAIKDAVELDITSFEQEGLTLLG